VPVGYEGPTRRAVHPAAAGVSGAVTEAHVVVTVQGGRPPVIPVGPLTGFDTPAPFPTSLPGGGFATQAPPIPRPTMPPYATPYPFATDVPFAPTQVWPPTPPPTYIYPPVTASIVTPYPALTGEPSFPPTWTPEPDGQGAIATERRRSPTHTP
jgi:hypothetical protein